MNGPFFKENRPQHRHILVNDSEKGVCIRLGMYTTFLCVGTGVCVRVCEGVCGCVSRNKDELC